MTSRRFGPRTQARSQALQLLFQAEATERSVASVLAGPFVLALDDEATIEEPLDEFAERLALGADDMREGLDAVISTFSRNWSLTRMPSVDRNLLRLAIYEMLEVEEVAHAVTIDESVELAKAFGTDESSRFVNGLLGRVAEHICAGDDIVGEALATQRALEEERLAAEAAEAAARAAEAAARAAEEAARAAAEAEEAVEAEGAEPADEAPEPTEVGDDGAVATDEPVAGDAASDADDTASDADDGFDTDADDTPEGDA